MMGSRLGVDRFGNPDELARMKTRREQLQTELLRINTAIRRIETEQCRIQQAERDACLQSSKPVSLFGWQLDRYMRENTHSTMLGRFLTP